ncbi:MAG: glycosyltransferase family 4 protein [Deltaproteobacteria bacterium]|nr:glycosyltransferase family 4 protein [Deltaproteobacteria bacterium]
MSISIALLLKLQLMPDYLGYLLLTGGTLIALLGFADDHMALSAKIRLFVHLITAIGVVLILSSKLSSDFQVEVLHLKIPLALAVVFATLYMVWMINLYNFMDGIDGIASSQCASVAGVLAVFSFISGSTGLGLAYALLFVTSLGFIVLNWQPAKIFMGDVGSGYLGFCFALLCLWGEITGRIFWITSTILMGVFMVDATYTLCQRAFRKQRIFRAHCDHAYQKAVRLGWSHSQVSKAVILINFLWLTPFAWISLCYPSYSLVMLGIAYLPLVIIAWRLRAGVPS